jgi:hypothetical protein
MRENIDQISCMERILFIKLWREIWIDHWREMLIKYATVEIFSEC